MNHPKFSTVLILLLFAGAIFPSCNRRVKTPEVQMASHWVRQHFENEVYDNLVGVVDVELVNVVEDSHLESRFMNVILRATIDVKEDHMISRMFMFNRFEVNPQWPENYRAQMEAAETDQDRERIRQNFDMYTFSKGKHQVNVNVEFVFVDERWMLFAGNFYAI